MKHKVIISILIITILLLIINDFHQINKFENKHTQCLNLEEVLKIMDTGDIVLIKHNNISNGYYNYYISNILTNIVDSFYNHVELVIKIDNIPYLYSSNIEPYYDVITKQPKTGIVLKCAKQYLKECNGYVTLHKLNNTLPENTTQFLDYITEKRNITHPGQIGIILELMGIRKNNDIQTMMCTQSVADCLKFLGLPMDHYKKYIGLKSLESICKSDLYNSPIRVIVGT